MRKMKPTFRVGRVTVRDLGSGKWQVRFKDPLTGRDIPKRVQAETVSQIKEIADHIDREILVGRGFLPGRRATVPTVKDAMENAIRLSNRRPHVKRETKRQGNAALDWLEVKFPWVQTFDQLKPSMVKEYRLHLEAEEYAWESINKMLAPIRLAWFFVEENFPGTVPRYPRMKSKAPKPGKPECLEPSEVKALFDYLKETESPLYPLAVLQGLAGVRMLEAAFLRLQDVDLDRGLIAITDTEEHGTKNDPSKRSIPVCSEVRQVLSEWLDCHNVIAPTGEVFLSRGGRVWTETSVRSEWYRTREKAKKESEELRKKNLPPLLPFWRLPAMNLRKFFTTNASRSGLPERLVQAYLGQVPKSIMGARYDEVHPSELKAVSDSFGTWREVKDLSHDWKELGNKEVERIAK